MGDFGGWTGDVSSADDSDDDQGESSEGSSEQEQGSVDDSPSETNGSVSSDSLGSDEGKGNESVERNGSSPSLSVQSVSDMEDDSDDATIEKNEDDGTSSSVDGSPDIPVPDNAERVDEVAERERRWKIMVWGRPGLFKTHFGCTMPEPVALLDLEGKAQDTAKKFREREICIWEPDDFRDAQSHLSEALDWLRAYRDATGQIGTVVVDSMGMAWEWAQTQYKTEAYPMTENEEVTLSSNLGSSKDSDWQHIKGMHNSEFRRWMVDSDFHFLWTAGEKKDIRRVMSTDKDDDRTPMTNEGEKNNSHKADTILRARYDDQHGKVGDLVKSNFTNNKFVEMELPTFGKLEGVIEGIEAAEADPEGVRRSEINKEHDVKVIRGKPKQYEEV